MPSIPPKKLEPSPELVSAAEELRRNREQRGAQAPQLPYVRCQDLEGQWWTIPSGPAGGLLHQQLWSDLEQHGQATLYVPRELLRAPWRGLDMRLRGLDMLLAFSSRLDDYKATAWAMTALDRSSQAHRLYRVGQFLRLQHRVKVRTSTNG